MMITQLVKETQPGLWTLTLSSEPGEPGALVP